MAALESRVIYRSLTEEDWPWLTVRAKAGLAEGATGIVVERDEQIVGAVAFMGWMPQAATAHIAIDDPRVTRGLLKELFHYFYVSCGRSILLAPVISNNAQGLRFVKKLGFQMIGRIYGAVAPGVDLLLFELRKGNCRWLEPEYREAA